MLKTVAAVVNFAPEISAPCRRQLPLLRLGRVIERVLALTNAVSDTVREDIVAAIVSASVANMRSKIVKKIGPFSMGTAYVLC